MLVYSGEISTTGTYSEVPDFNDNKLVLRKDPSDWIDP